MMIPVSTQDGKQVVTPDGQPLYYNPSTGKCYAEYTPVFALNDPCVSFVGNVPLRRLVQEES